MPNKRKRYINRMQQAIHETYDKGGKINLAPKTYGKNNDDLGPLKYLYGKMPEVSIINTDAVPLTKKILFKGKLI